jgi:tetratricopeptide (TPR) repeat protein
MHKLIFWVTKAAQITLVCLGVGAGTVWGQTPSASRVDSLFLAQDRQRPVEVLQSTADSLIAVGQRIGDCALEQVGIGLYVLYNGLKTEELEAIIPEERCPIVGFHVRNSIATRFYLNQNYPKALEWLESAQRATTSNADRMACAIGIGACHSGMGDQVAAFRSFNEAYNLAEHPAPVVLLNNLAASQISFGLFEDAIELLEEALRQKNLTKYERQLIHLNRINAFCNLDQLNEAEAEYLTLREILPSRLDAMSFKILLDFALELETPERWLELKDNLGHALTYLDHAYLFEEEDPGRMLFADYDDDWRQLGVTDTGSLRWQTIKSLKVAYNRMRLEVAKDLLEERNALAESTLSNDKIGIIRTSRWWWFVILFAVIGLGVGWGLRQRMLRRKEDEGDANLDLSQIPLISRMSEALDSGSLDAEMGAALKDLKNGVHENIESKLKGNVAAKHDLSKIELQALVFFVLGYSPKNVAVLLDRSVG